MSPTSDHTTNPLSTSVKEDALKVLFVTTWFPTEEQPGSGPFVLEQAKAVQQQGATVKILQIRPIAHAKLYHTRYHHRWVGDIEVISVFLESRFSKLLYFAYPMMTRAAWAGYNQHFDDFKPDLIHGQVIYPAGFVAHWMAQQWNIPLHISEHWSKSPDFLRRLVMGQKALQVYKSAFCVYPVSAWLRSALQAARGDIFYTDVVPNVVDPALFAPRSTPPPRDTEAPLQLLCVMSFEHQLKRPDLIFDALESLPPEEQTRYQIRCIGSHQQDSALAQRIASMDLNTTISLEGPLPKPKVAEAMREADYLVHPSEKETFGLVVAEALSVGLPVICSQRGALPELVDARHGYLVGQNDVSDWATALRWAWQQPYNYDPLTLSSDVRQLCSPETIGKRLLRHYRHSLKHKH
ncbi:MAG: glycosyltransferase [Bacteroidota bacterium]